MIFNRRTITKLLDLVNLQRHNENYADIQTDLTNHEGRITGAQSDITTHKASTAAHPAEHVTYEGEIIGAENIKEGLDIIKTELDQAIISGDSGPEAAASRYNPFTGVTHATLPDRLNEEWEQTATQLVDKATQTVVEVVGDPKIVGHRGLSGVAPENTIPSYVMAGKAGLWGAETDIQRTSDGVWVLMHDMDVDRMTNGTGFVKDLTFDYIRSLKIDAGVNIGLYPNLKVPTLEEYLMTCKQYSLVPVIEVKSLFVAADCVDLVNMLKKYNFEENCIVLTGDLLILWEIRKYSQRIHGQYLAPVSDISLMHVTNIGNASINEYFETLTKAKIEQAHAVGVSVNTWTVNSYEKARELIRFGVDMLSTDVIANIKF